MNCLIKSFVVLKILFLLLVQFCILVLYYVQASESGVHRPHVSGIHGRDCDGAYSIVLAGGYEDDVVSNSWMMAQVISNYGNPKF